MGRPLRGRSNGRPGAGGRHGGQRRVEDTGAGGLLQKDASGGAAGQAVPVRQRPAHARLPHSRVAGAARGGG
eukprot:3038766-Prymnesium_polylepis.1